MDYTNDWINQVAHEHHRQAIYNVRDQFINNPDVLAVVLGGSIAHGYYRTDSDIDCMILVSEEEYSRRLKDNNIQYFSRELAPYEGGYIDGKYHSLEYLEKVASFGAEPARFAFKDSKIIFSRIPNLLDLLSRAAAYPKADKSNRIQRFHAQLDGLRWFFGEGAKRNDRYTINWSSTSMVLFGCRMLLAHNNMLFPCQKTMTFELQKCKNLPENLFEKIDLLLNNPTLDNAESFYRLIKDYRQWEETPNGWPNQYMADSELMWLNGQCPVSDI